MVERDIKKPTLRKEKKGRDMHLDIKRQTPLRLLEKTDQTLCKKDLKRNV
jgi:hypothetical protein